MNRSVALLRGINVGRANRVAMADLRTVLESLVYRNVTTLLNSGNAVFEGGNGTPAAQAERSRAALVRLAALRALVGDDERLQIGAHAAYLWCPEGIVKRRAGAALLGKPPAETATRNRASVLKFADLMRGDLA